MKGIVIAVVTLVAIDGSAQAQDRNMEGYLHCSLRNLAACDNSSRLVTGLRDHSYSHFFEKKETTNAIRSFVRGAVREDDVVYAFWEPGETHFHFPSGEWFFDGFTPHAATARAAVLFNAKGGILLAASLKLGDPA